MPFISFSQTSFSTNYKEQCDWNQYTSNWETSCVGDDASSLFVMNSDETMFTHTTESMKSTYYVDSKESGDDGIFTYRVTSDVGNKYYYVFDMKAKEVKAASTRGEESEWYMVRWYVKAIF